MDACDLAFDSASSSVGAWIVFFEHARRGHSRTASSSVPHDTLVTASLESWGSVWDVVGSGLLPLSIFRNTIGEESDPALMGFVLIPIHIIL